MKDVSLQFRKGDLISLIGPSGCGKTTVLKMMGGLIPASSGLLELDGKAITGPFPGVGVVFQTPTLMPWRSVLGNVLFPMEVLGKNDRKAKERAHEILKLTGLEGFEHAYPRQLSGGMQQRVALCRAIIHEPSILLMDEPFGALDELTRLEMNDLLLDLRRVTGATVIFVTHSISEADLSVGSRVRVLQAPLGHWVGVRRRYSLSALAADAVSARNSPTWRSARASPWGLSSNETGRCSTCSIRLPAPRSS